MYVCMCLCNIHTDKTGSRSEELTTLKNMQPKDRLEQDIIFLKKKSLKDNSPPLFFF